MEHVNQPVTVLFVDITDSTGLFLRLGDLAATRLERDWLSRVRDLVARYEGRFVKAIGDEAMCAFSSPDQAVLAACEIQTMTAQPPFRDHAIRLHIGMHYGPVVAHEDDLFGDTVNVAAFLCSVARGDQIVLADATHRLLSPALQAYSRPVFHTRLKAHPDETTLYQVLWKTGDLETTMSLFDERATQERIPPEPPGLLLVRDGVRTHLNFWKNHVAIGRDPACQLVVDRPWVSRRHAHIKLVGHDFYLVDDSINATFVTDSTGREVNLVRSGILLVGSGTIAPGRTAAQEPESIIEFTRDRRSLYRP
jgi:class 3 adenylate cyclase